MHTLSRWGAALSLVMLMGGCSSSVEQAGLSERRDECGWNRSSCIYEGRYEPDERDYAEEQAKRLNRAQLDRLRRWGG